jgi:glycosyltransferase involved in cell wall biosynthesis
MPPSVRVLHVLKVYRPDFSGEGVFLERCAPHFESRATHVRHDLLVTVTPGPAEIAGGVQGLDRICHLVRRSLPWWKQELMLWWWFARHLSRYRTVHFRTHADRYFLSYVLVKLWRRRLILSATLDDSVPVLVGSYRPSLRFLARWAFGLFDGFISISRKLHDETRTMAPAERCHLIENGIPFPESKPDWRSTLRRQFGIPDDALVLVFVGGLCDRKDPRLLVRCHPDVLADRPDCRLLLVGPELEPAYVAALRADIATADLSERVIPTGEVPDPHPFYAAADIMVFASKNEGFGMVVPEAMGHGLPVVVRRLPGVNDSFVEDGVTGFAFDDDQGYVAAVRRLVLDPALRQTIGGAGRALVREKFDLNQVAASYLRVYGVLAD